MGGDAGLRIDFSRRPRTGRTVDPRPLVACRVAVPWRGGQRSLSKVTLTVSAENLPVPVDGARVLISTRSPACFLRSSRPASAPNFVLVWRYCVHAKPCRTIGPAHWSGERATRRRSGNQGRAFPARSKFRRRVGRLVAEPPAPRPVPEGLLPGPRVLQPEVGRRSALTRILRRAGNAMTRETRSGFFGSRPASLI